MPVYSRAIMGRALNCFHRKNKTSGSVAVTNDHKSPNGIVHTWVGVDYLTNTLSALVRVIPQPALSKISLDNLIEIEHLSLRLNECFASYIRANSTLIPQGNKKREVRYRLIKSAKETLNRLIQNEINQLSDGANHVLHMSYDSQYDYFEFISLNQDDGSSVSSVDSLASLKETALATYQYYNAPSL